MNKLILSIVTSISLTGCFTTQQAYQPQPQVVYVQQAPQQSPIKPGYNTYGNGNTVTQSQTYRVRDNDTGEVRRITVTPR